MTSKKLLVAIIILTSVFSFAGCRSLESMQGLDTPSKDKAVADSKDAVQKNSPISKLNSKYETYQKWLLPESILQANKSFFKSSGHYDCISLENGNTLGGDVLSTLIADDGARKNMKLIAYKPAYVESLYKKINRATEEKYKASVYAFKVCHLSPNVDVVAGYLWPSDEKVELKNESQTEDNFTEKKILAIVNNDNVLLHDDIQVLDNNADGKGMACLASLRKNIVKWSCFQGPHIIKIGEQEITKGGDMKSWEIPLDGKAIKTSDWIK